MSHPVIFSAAMVRAILDGQKTMTRRVIDMAGLRVRLPYEVKSDLYDVLPQPMRLKAEAGAHPAGMNPHGAVWAKLGDGKNLGLRPGEFDFVCPYVGRATTRSTAGRWQLELVEPAQLWVREAWQAEHGPSGPTYLYRADDVELPEGHHWRSPRFMPRAASRLVLDVESVRVERLHSIPSEEILREGIDLVIDEDIRETFARGWNRINGRRPGCAWQDDPFVWAITFRRATPARATS